MNSSARRPLRVLVICGDRVGASMGGTGIRAVELARVVQEALGAQVTIAAAESDGAELGLPVVGFQPHAPAGLDAHLRDCDAVIAQPGWPLLMRRLTRSGARLVFDLYDPELFGTLEHFARRGALTRSLTAGYAADRLVAALRIGHHVMCASERQRDLWIGAMLGARLISPDAHERDPSGRERLDVVPYGVPGEPPRRPQSEGPRARFGIGEGELVLWNGGIWSWLDASSAIRAIALVRERRPSARLVFMGASQAAPALEAARRARELARELGLLGSAVVFNESWVPYQQRAAWLLDADCAISTHLEHLETRFSSRTRVLDCFWARLPVVCTRGDELAARVEREDLGATAPAADPRAIADALERVLRNGRESYRERLAAAAEENAWPRVAAPLLRWLSGPPPAGALGARRGLERSPAELLRTGAYIVGAGTLGALRLKPPALR